MDQREDSSVHHERMLKALNVAFATLLTEKQKLYIRLYFVDGMLIQQIASEHHVNKSTVSRTIARGLARLRKTINCVF